MRIIVDLPANISIQREIRWADLLMQAQQHLMQYGKLPLQTSLDPVKAELGQWLSNQNYKNKSVALPEHRISALNAVDPRLRKKILGRTPR